MIAYRILHKDAGRGEDLECVYKVCAKTEKGRVHLQFHWSEYSGDPFGSPHSPLSLILSPCDCDLHPLETMGWAQDAVRHYQETCPGKTAIVDKGLKGDLSLLEVPWVVD